jgi:L-lactate dehydrogenase
MKVAIIGTGNVGKAIFHDLQHVNMIREITLVGRNKKKAEAEVVDAKDAAVLWEEYGPKLDFGGYEKTKGADIIVYTAGTSKIENEDRLEILHSNCTIAEEVFTEINRYNQDAIILCVTNPLDVITMKIQQVSGRPARKVIGTGTLLDTARLVRIVSEFLEISDRQIYIPVVGEHGASAVSLFSSFRIMGMTMDDYLKSVTGTDADLNVKALEDIVKKGGWRIFAGKGYTSTGVSAAVCRIVANIASDGREILPVSSVLQGEYGVHGIATSVLSVVGKNGIEDIHKVMMTDEERDGFLISVDTIRQAAKSAGIIE